MQRIRWAAQRKDDHGHLAADTDGIENQEGAIAQPVKSAGHDVELLKDEVRVPDDLGGAPGHQHRRVKGPNIKSREGIRDTPHEKEAASNLHGSRKEGGRDNAYEGGRLAWTEMRMEEGLPYQSARGGFP
jgi:hypothetical protein